MEQELALVEQELALVRHSLKLQLERRRKLNAATKDKPRSLCRTMLLLVSFMCLVLGGHEAPVEFLKGTGRKKRFIRHESFTGEFQQAVTSACCQLTDSEVSDLMFDPQKLLSWKRIILVSRYVVERNIYCLALKSNFEHGVAPNIHILVSHRDTLIPQSIPDDVKSHLVSLLCESSDRRASWLKGLRKRWGMRHGQLGVEPDVPLDELQCKSRVFFQWANHLEASLGEILWVNMDETAITYTFSGHHGLVVSKRSRPGGCKKPVQTVPSNQKRGTVSLLTFVCSDSSLQPLCPQVVLGNEHKFTLKLLQKFPQSRCPQNVSLWRQKSSWNNTVAMRKVLLLLHAQLKDHLGSRSLVLVLDCCSCHLEASVRRLAKALEIHLLFIPPLATWLLQPLDTHGFKCLKQHLKNKWVEALLLHGRSLNDEQWLSTVLDSLALLRQKKSCSHLVSCFCFPWGFIFKWDTIL